MRRLNFVYRLGIVATVLWLVWAPLVFTVHQTVTWGDMHKAFLDDCLSQARSGPEEKLATASDACFEDMSDGWKRFDQAEAYWIGLGGSVFLAMLAWILPMNAFYTSRRVLTVERLGISPDPMPRPPLILSFQPDAADGSCRLCRRI